MARLNAKRRREIAQRKAATQLAKEFNPSTQATTGEVRNAHKTRVLNQIVPAVARAYTPKPPMWEGQGQKVRKPAPKPAVKAERLPYDSLREHYRKAWKAGRPIRKEPD